MVDSLVSPHLIPVGISSCLLGQQVRYNGGHKHDEFCTQVLGRYFQFTPYCPEVAIGMGIPREPIRLVGDLEEARALGTVHPEMDFTEPLLGYADSVRPGMDILRGYIFMKDSPSCGLYSTKIYGAKGGVALGKRAGLFAGRLQMHFPLLPMEESGRLHDPALRENFIARVYVYDRWMRQAPGMTPHKLVEFHSQHKYFVMSFSQKLYRELGALVAKAGLGDSEQLAQDYIARLMTGTRKPPTHKGHVNVLYHMVGYLRKTVPGGIRQDLARAIEEYRLRQVPLAVPLKLMQHYLDNYASDYIRRQTYLNPYPYELGLRNLI